MNTQQIVQVAKTYAGHTGLKISTVGVYAARDGKFFARLEKGGGCTLKTAASVTQWFSDHWPADLEWPADVPRPRPAPIRRAG